MTTTKSAPITPPVEPPPPGAWTQLKPLVLRLHFYAGIFIAPFILLAAVTGLLYTAAPQIEQAVYRHELTVTPGEAMLPLSEQVAAAREAHPAGDLVEVRGPIADDSSTRVVFTDKTVPTDYNMAVFVNPYNAQVLGQVRTFGQWLGVRAWIDDLHRNLHLGAVGRNYSELAASWLWVVVLGGASLWLTKRRQDRRARRLLLPETSAQGRRRTLSWHASVGLWLAVGAVGLSATGMMWSRFAGDHIGVIRQELSWTGTSLDTALGSGNEGGGTHSGHHAGGPVSKQPSDNGVTIDDVLTAARAEGLRDPLVLTPPEDAQHGWAVSENKRSLPTRFDAVAVDAVTGNVVNRYDFATQPLVAKLVNWTIDAHMGILFGLANQLLLAATAVGLIVVIIAGYRAWWQRRPTRSTTRRWARPPRRGAWRQLHPALLATVVLLTGAIAWLAPLFGGSLLAFLVIDGIVGATRRSGESAGRDTSEDSSQERADELILG